MAATIGNFADIDDTAVDAESPITESLMTQLRDNAYWIDSSFTKSDQGSADYLLETDGSGGVQWVTKNSVQGINGTKGGGSTGTSSGSPTQVSVISDRFLRVDAYGVKIGSGESLHAHFIIDSSDNTFVSSAVYLVSGGNEISTVSSGTLTGSFQAIGTTTGVLQARVTGGNYEFYSTFASGTFKHTYIWF